MCRDKLIFSALRKSLSFARPGGLVPLALLVAGLAHCGMSGSAWGKNPLLPAKKPAAPAQATDAKDAKAAPAEEKKQELLATVNGEDVKRDELARECLKRYGSEVLDSVLHKEMIAEYCRTHNVVVSDKEVEDEIDRMASKFNLPKDQWVKLLEKERGIKRKQYSRDIIWPTLALRKLVAPKLTVTKEEMEKAYESQFGAAVKVRLIVMSNAQQAQAIRAKAVANPENFASLARQHSEDPASASAGGLMQPIRRYLGDPGLEQVAFGLRENEISPVFVVRNQQVFMKCEGHIEPTKVDRVKADPLIEDALKEGKLHKAAAEKFLELEKESTVQLFYGNADKEKQNPGIAAMINDHRITRRELAEECIDRHGTEVLEKIIDHRLVEQALRKRNFVVSDPEIDAEIAHAAFAMGQKKPNGEPDVEAWLKLVTQQEKVPVDVYKTDAIWPSVALKKLVGEKVTITEEDIKKGYEANYGARVRCRAIVLANQRKAQEVWEKARDKATLEEFSRLAKQYSIDSNSGSLGGEVPPIQKHGGQPILEREAFQLKPGELSGVIQVGEQFVILFSEGFTKPVEIDMQEARRHIQSDLQEKKQRIAMGKEFERLKEGSEIDNYLAGTLHHPKGMNPAAGGLPGAPGMTGDDKSMANPPNGTGERRGNRQR
jgi:parvulin-like peptidyl-prolyl isomerase